MFEDEIQGDLRRGDEVAIEERQRFTVSLSRETLRKAKVVAANQGTPVSSVLQSLLENYVRKHDSYERARDDYLAILKDQNALNLGTKGQAI